MKLRTLILKMFDIRFKNQLLSVLRWRVFFLSIISTVLWTSVYSQDDISWRSEANNGDWQHGSSCDNSGSDDNWYNNTLGASRWRPDCYIANRITFGNPNKPNMNLNSGPDYAVNQLIFNSGTASRTINTDASISLYFWQASTDATIENNAGGTTHTFNVNVNIQGGSTWMQIRVNDGYLVFNKPVVNNSGNTLNLRGNNNMQIIFNDYLISAPATTPGVNIWGNAHVIYGGTPESKTYAGITTINSGGTLQISSNQTLGAITLNSGGNLIVDAGCTLTITGAWTGGGTIINNGTIVLAGPTTFPGATTTLSSMTNLTINNPSGVTLDKELQVSGVLTLTNGVVTTTAANLLWVTNSATSAITGYSASSYINGPVQRSLLSGIGSDGTDYFFPVSDELSNYRPFELLNIRTGATPPEIMVTVASTGASTVDATITSIAPRNWHAEVISGNFTSTTVRITENSLGINDVVGSSVSLPGPFTNQGGNSIGATITSNSGLALPNYFAIGTNASVTLQPDLSGLCIGDTVAIPINVTGVNVWAIDLYLVFDHSVLLNTPMEYRNVFTNYDAVYNYNYPFGANTAYFGIQESNLNGHDFIGEAIVELLFIYNGGTTNIHLSRSPDALPPPYCKLSDPDELPITPVTYTDNNVTGYSTRPTALITPGGPTTFCQGNSVTLMATTGINYTYIWSTGATTDEITVSAGGIYIVTVTDVNGCSDTASQVVTVNPLPTAVITPGGPTTFCQGGSVTLTASGGTTYLWSNAETTAAITVSVSGTYTVTVTDINGCSDTASQVVTVNPLPTAVITPGGPTTFCQGGSVTLTASGGTSYLWSTSETTPAITVSATDIYTVTVTDVNGCTDNMSQVITVIDNNTISTTSGAPIQSVCINTPIETIIYTTWGATGAIVSGLPAGVTGSWAGGFVTISGTPTVTGIFNYTVTLTGGCGNINATGTITVHELPQAQITPSGPTTFCQGGSVTLTASGGTSYLWSTSETTPAITASATDIYSVTVTDANGCTDTASEVVTVNPPNTIVLSSPAYTTNQTVCINDPIDNITYTTTGATGATFSGLPTGVTGVWAGNVVTISGTPNTTTGSPFTYTITLTGGCDIVTTTGTITVLPYNTITLTSAPETAGQHVCINTPIINITYTTTGASGLPVVGLPPGVAGTWAGNDLTISGTPTVSGLFNYTVGFTGGCGDPATGFIEAFDLPTTSTIYHN